MRNRSLKREALYKKRRSLVEKVLLERPACEACQILAAFRGEKTYVHHPSQDLHELINRSQGGDFLNEEEILAVCRACHNWITTHPLPSQRLGLHLPSWATAEMFREANYLRRTWANGEPAEASWLQE